MLDKRCIALLDVINSNSNDSGYKIFSFEELISLLPIRLSFDVEGLMETLSNLSRNEFISIKYQDENEVCLRPLIKGRVAIENKTEKDLEENSFKKKLIIFSFLGGLFGGLLSGVIIFVIKIIGGGIC